MVDDDGNRVAGDDKFCRCDSVRFRFRLLFGFYLPRGVGDVNRPIDQRSDPRSRTTARNRQTDVRANLLISLSPRERQVNDRIRAFVLDGTGD
jgi:hypothetical protein